MQHETGMTQFIGEKAGTLQQMVLCPTQSQLQGTPLVVQWLRLHASTAGGTGLIPGWRTKSPAYPHSQKKKEQVGSRWIKYLNEKNKMLT